MSVVGFDVGNLNCYVAVARAGGVETVANEYSDRCTPALVAFTAQQRIVGVSAKNQAMGNLKNTVRQFKRLLGRKFDDPLVQQEIPHLPYKVIAMADGGVGVEVMYLGNPLTLSATQVMAALLTELKIIAESNLSTKVIDCVVSVPSYFTDEQRKEYLTACQIANLNCLRLMNETTAIALSYGLYKQDLPAAEEKPKHVVFVDVGHSSTQVCICAFNKGKFKVLSVQTDPSLGGRDFDSLIQNYFAEEIKKKYKLDVRSNPKAWARLSTESEKMKKLMSANSQELPMNIECLMNDVDVSCKISRDIMEEMASDLLNRILVPLKGALAASGLAKEDINGVEIVGGSTRIVSIKRAIESVFGSEIRTTLNADEAVARGCAIQCAMLSPTFKVRDIDITDATPYPICIAWKATPSNEQGEVEIFGELSSFPATKMLTLHRKEPFELEAYYSSKTHIPHTQKTIGHFLVKGVCPTAAGEPSKIKVKVKLNIHGVFGVTSAAMIEQLPKVEETPTPMETSPSENTTADSVGEGDNKNQNNEESAPASSEQQQTDEPMDDASNKPSEPNTEGEEAKTSPAGDSSQPKPKKQKSQVKSIDLGIEQLYNAMQKTSLDCLIEKENEMIMQVRMEKDRADACNAVEEYVYAMRDKISDLYEKFVTEKERSAFSQLLRDTEDWLYGDGENQRRQVYADKLNELKKYGQPIVDRFTAHQAVPPAFDQFGHAVQHFRKILDLYAKKEEKYAHLEAEEMKKVEKKVQDKFDWLNKHMNTYRSTPSHAMPEIMASQIHSELKAFQEFCNNIVNKPKPKVEPPKDKPEEKKETNGEKPAGKTDGTQNTAQDKTEQKPGGNPTGENLDMEVD